MKMDKNQIALKYLNKDPLLNADIIDSIIHHQADVIYADSLGVMVFNNNSDAYGISADIETDIDGMLNLCKADADCFVTHQDFYFNKIEERFGLKQKVECYQAVYTKKIPIQHSYDFEIRELTLDYIDFVVKNYSRSADADYITERINSKCMYGAFLGADIMGFIGVHDEGAMGMLEVMAEHKRKGVGYALEAYLINEKLKQGHIPYAHIIISNTASYSLQKKLGLEFADGIVSWVF